MGKKSSVYLTTDTTQQLASARAATGRDLKINAVVNESAALYAQVVMALQIAPACTVRFTPVGWVVEPTDTVS